MRGAPQSGLDEPATRDWSLNVRPELTGLSLGADRGPATSEESRVRQGGLAACSTTHLTREHPMTILRQRMTEDMQVRNLSPLTQLSYVQQVSLFARHFDKSPSLLGVDEIRSYQIYLANEKKLSPKS